jgi:hypothetical protein
MLTILFDKKFKVSRFDKSLNVVYLIETIWLNDKSKVSYFVKPEKANVSIVNI